MGILADYNYRIVYRPGAQNRKADILSRRIELKEEAKGGGEAPVLIPPELFISAIQTDSDLNDMIRDALYDDKSVQKILKSLEEGVVVKVGSWIMAYYTIMGAFMYPMSQKSAKPYWKAVMTTLLLVTQVNGEHWSYYPAIIIGRG
jgi:hypothetical protein